MALSEALFSPSGRQAFSNSGWAPQLRLLPVGRSRGSLLVARVILLAEPRDENRYDGCDV